MAVIDSKKLLPPAKSSGSALSTQKFLVPISNIKVKSSAIIRASDIKPSEKSEDGGGGKIVLSEVLQIRENITSIQRVIVSNTTLLQQSEERKRKLLEKEKFESKEKKLEEKKGLSIPQLKSPSLPRTGFLDAIKRFLFYTLLGAAFVKFGKYIPKILEFSKKLIPAFKFVEDFAGNILNGVVDFVGAGYKAYDKVREITKQIGGEDLQKKFDEFSKQFNTFANLALIAGMSTMGGTDFGINKKGKPGIDRVKGQRVNKATQSRYLSRYGKTAFTNRFGKQSLSGISGKSVGKFAGKALGRVPIIGGLIDFIISTVIFKEKPGRAAARAVGSTIGAALGTFVPVPFAGTILGGVLGDIVGGALYDSLVGSKPESKAKGGEVTRGGRKVSGPARRTIKRVKARPPKVKPQKTIPGKDVGGRKEIEKLFPYSINPNQKSPLGVLETTSESLKKVPLLGGVMGASLDLAMGQKPDAGVFKKIGYGFGALVQNAIDAETSNTIGNIQKEIVGLAGGGSVPRTLSSNENIGMKIGQQLAKTFEVMMNAKVSETLQAIRQQFSKEGMGTGSTSSPTGPTGELNMGAVNRGQLTIEQLVGLAKGAGFSQSDAVTMAAVAMAESSGISTRFRSDTDVHGLWQIRFPVHVDKLKSLGITTRDQLYDPVANAAAAKAVYDSQGISAWSAYKNGNYQSYLSAAQKASSASPIKVYKPTNNISLGSGYGGAGVKIAGDLGRYIYQVLKSPEQFLRVTEHPDFGGISGRHTEPGYTGYHKYGRAIDIGAYAHEQGPVLKAIQQFNQQRGIKPVQVFHAGNDPDGSHQNHVHVAYAKGGRVLKPTYAILAEEGPEFVFDADTTKGLDQMAPNLLDSLNIAKTKSQLAGVLQSYASYYNPTPATTIMLQKVIIEKPVPVGGGGMISGGVNNSSASTSPITASLYSA